ncbi:MAG: SWIM zinc finger family protein [Deltaproteobacteria bacterium]|nr:SWIM zinc finger family protein [Deltaproteobacteria bacterium]
MSDNLTIPVSFGPTAVKVNPDGGMRVSIPTDGERAGAHLAARLHRPGVVRDALLAMGDVLASDLRRKATDRADYLAYLIQRGKGVGKAVWDAQKEYLALQYGVAAKQDESIDPVLTVGPEALRLELMSRDEATYAQLTLRRPAALVDADHPGDAGRAYGSTFVDLGAALASIARVRSYRPTTFDFAPARSGANDNDPKAARSRTVPMRWLRAFGQMQAATLLAAERFELAPIDLYNVLLTLRMRKARTAPRGLRYELVPGEPPRLVLEPWDLVVRGTGGPYQGSQPRVIRTWGRQRLSVLSRILPHARRLDVAIAGPGLPAVYVVDLGDATLSLALSGWTDAGWAGISTFDLLAADDDAPAIDAAVAACATPQTDAQLAAKLGRSRTDVRRTVLAGLAQLRLGHDLATGELYARPLLATPVPASALKFRDAKEAAAHRLLGEAGAIALTKVADQGIEGRAIEGQVVDAKAHRTFYPAFTIDREGRTSSASCTCNAFRRSGIKEGPCEHMVALRVQFAREQAQLEAARETPEGRAQITAETRILLRRTAKGAETFRLSLDGRTVTSRFGLGGALRMQRQKFDSNQDARSAYFARLEDLGAKGWLDATQD